MEWNTFIFIKFNTRLFHSTFKSFFTFNFLNHTMLFRKTVSCTLISYTTPFRTILCFNFIELFVL